MAETHEDDRKLFCGALPQEAKDTDVKEYFGQFGEIENVNLKMDPMTGRSRYFNDVLLIWVPPVNVTDRPPNLTTKIWISSGSRS